MQSIFLSELPQAVMERRQQAITTVHTAADLGLSFMSLFELRASQISAGLFALSS